MKPIGDVSTQPGDERRLRWVQGRLHQEHSGDWAGLLEALQKDLATRRAVACPQHAPLVEAQLLWTFRCGIAKWLGSPSEAAVTANAAPRRRHARNESR